MLDYNGQTHKISRSAHLKKNGFEVLFFIKYIISSGLLQLPKVNVENTLVDKKLEAEANF